MILRIFFFAALFFGAAVSLWKPLLVYFFPLFVLLFWSLFTFGAVLYLFTVSLFCYGKKPLEKDHPYCRFLAYHTMDCILALFRFRLSGKGLEKVPKEPCVLVCNHLSRFDPMVTFCLMKGRRLAFVSKKENMRIPIAGPITQKIGFLPLDRENPLSAMRTIRAAARLVSEKGFTMGIYPEGTRSREGELLDFKVGAFVLAKKANAPLVISRIEGTNEYKGNFPFRKTDVTFEVISVLDKETVQQKKPEELAELCRNMIKESGR